MKRLLTVIIGMALATGLHAESARSILDKAAATVSHKEGVTARFQVVSQQMGSTAGSISVKGRKFVATTPQATIWFDGKTQWTYMKDSEEVNVSQPTDEELQALNPYTFVNLYKEGFRLSQKAVGSSYEVHLRATDKKRRLQEMYIIVDQKSYKPTHVKMKQGGKWSTIVISGLKAVSLSDAIFQFNAKDFPKAEIIDLR